MKLQLAEVKKMKKGDIIIWKCICGYIELWNDSKEVFKRCCFKCTGYLSKQETLQEHLLERQRRKKQGDN